MRGRVEADRAAFRGLLVERLRRDRNKGVLPVSLDPEVIAGVVMIYSQGPYRMTLVDYDRQRCERAIDAFLRGLGL